MITSLLPVFLSVFLTLAHPYHVAVCQVDYDQKNTSLQITHKIFTDDLEKAIEQTGGTRLLLGNPKQLENARQVIGEYLSRHFFVKQNGRIVKLTYLGYETENDQLFIYYECKLTGKPKSLDITYDALTETFPDQSNLVHFSIGGVKKSLYFNSGKISGNAQF